MIGEYMIGTFVALLLTLLVHLLVDMFTQETSQATEIEYDRPRFRRGAYMNISWRCTYRPFVESTLTASDKMISAPADASEADIEERFLAIYGKWGWQFVSAARE